MSARPQMGQKSMNSFIKILSILGRGARFQVILRRTFFAFQVESRTQNELRIASALMLAIKEQGYIYIRICFFFYKKKQNRSCGSEASHFEIRSSETHIWGRISWRIRWWAQNPAGTTKSSCNSRQFMSDRNFRENHEKCFLCRISWGIEWCHPFSSTTPKSSPKCKKSISRFDLDHFSTFPGLLNRIFGIPVK